MKALSTIKILHFRRSWETAVPHAFIWTGQNSPWVLQPVLGAPLWEGLNQSGTIQRRAIKMTRVSKTYKKRLKDLCNHLTKGGAGDKTLQKLERNSRPILYHFRIQVMEQCVYVSALQKWNQLGKYWASLYWICALELGESSVCLNLDALAWVPALIRMWVSMIPSTFAFFSKCP